MIVFFLCQKKVKNWRFQEKGCPVSIGMMFALFFVISSASRQSLAQGKDFQTSLLNEE